MFFIYQIVVSIIIIFSPLLLFFRIIKNKEDKKRFIEKLSFTRQKRTGGNLIWFHGSSVGEILSIIPLIKHYEKVNSIKNILVTSSTLSSSKVLKKFKFKKTIHQFYPIDHIFFTNKFLSKWKPILAIFIESEIWPAMFKNIREKNIPLILLNARLTEKTFLRWMKIKYFSKSVFNNISSAYPQNLETRLFLKKIYPHKTKILGNLKFIENDKKNDNKINNNLNLEFKNKKIWVAASTHKNEEIFCLKAHLRLKKKVKNLLTIIIPRHIHRINSIIDETKKLELKVTTHSSNPKKLKNIDVYLVDTFGESKKFYKIASTVFLGGSIIERGGQNPLEAARYGARILHGKHIYNFKDIYKLLASLKVSKKISSSNELASLIVYKKNKRIGLKIKNIGEKILKKTINELDNLIKNETKKT